MDVTGVPAGADERRTRLLLRAGRTVAASLDLDRTLQAVAEACVPDLADICSLHVIDDTGELRSPAVAVSEARHLARCAEFLARRPPRIDDPIGIGMVAREGKPFEVAGLTAERARQADSEASGQIVAELAIRASVILPILGSGGPIGALSLTMAWSGREFGRDDLHIAEDIAARAAAAIENARLHGRLQRLQKLASELSRARTPEDVARVVADVAAPAAGAESSTIYLREPRARDLEPIQARGSLREPPIPLDADDLVARVLRDARDTLPEATATAVLCLADREARPFGALRLGFGRARVLRPAEREHLRAIADQVGEALVRVRLEQTAILRQELLESQTEAGLDGIFFQDVAGRPAFHNRRLLEIFGVPPDVPTLETMEERLARSMHAIAEPEAFAALARRMEEDPQATHRFDLRLRDGRTLDAYTSPVRAPTGERLGRAWYYRDVTEARRLQEELVEARRQLAHSEKLAAMGTLVSGVAHEIRTPLAYMANHAELMLRAVASPRASTEDLTASARAIHEGVDRINGLVGTLRRFARFERVGQSCRLDPAVETAVRLVIAARGGSMDVALDLGSAAIVKAERLQVQQVVINLLENAGDAAPGRTARVGTALVDGDAVIAVEDEGPGIAAEVADRMFEPFFTTKPGGTGLGLAIVRRIVEAHGGKVSAASRPTGGTRIEVRLPATREA